MSDQVIIGAILTLNEGGPDRYLRQCIAALRECCTTILVLDDGSEDDTVDIARSMGCVVQHRLGDPMWGQESPARQELWDYAEWMAGPDGWILVADADQVLMGTDRIPQLAQSEQTDAWAWPLYDLWTPTEYRADGFWKAHETPRVWMARNRPEKALWGTNGIHTGHIPPNWRLAVSEAPSDVYWLHYSYVTPKFRELKSQQYLSQSDKLDAFQLAHARSILDEA